MKRACRPWVEALPIKQQCVLFSAMRGPDYGRVPKLKRCVRWLRSLVVHPVAHGHYTTIGGKMPGPKAVARQAEWLTQHYINHFCEALHVVARFHPERSVRVLAKRYLTALLKDVIPLVRDVDRGLLEGMD